MRQGVKGIIDEVSAMGSLVRCEWGSETKKGIIKCILQIFAVIKWRRTQILKPYNPQIMPEIFNPPMRKIRGYSLGEKKQ